MAGLQVGNPPRPRSVAQSVPAVYRGNAEGKRKADALESTFQREGGSASKKSKQARGEGSSSGGASKKSREGGEGGSSGGAGKKSREGGEGASSGRVSVKREASNCSNDRCRLLGLAPVPPEAEACGTCCCVYACMLRFGAYVSLAV